MINARCTCVCVCVSKISETTKYKALKKAKKSKFLCCVGLAGYVIANCFMAAKVKHLSRIGKEIIKKYRNLLVSDKTFLELSVLNKIGLNL